VLKGRDVDGVAEVMRKEERGKRADDQVVEEEHPAGDEPGEVVERAPDEGRGAAGLAELGGPLGVRERDDEEEDAGPEQDPGREAERVRCDDPEREVDRGGDLPVGDRDQLAPLQPTAQLRQLAGHG
jgi:hypothetical protein